MSLTSILLLLQLTVSLLVGVQKNPNATAEQKNQALSFAAQAIVISQNYITAGAALTTPPAVPVPAASTSTTSAPTASTTPTQNMVTSPILVTALGPTTNRTKTSVDDIAILTFSPSGSGGISLTTLKITFSGNLASSTFSDADVKLLNTSNVPVGTLASVTCNTGSTCAFSWSDFGSNGIVSSGSSLVLKLRIDSLTNTAPATAGVSDTLGVAIQAAGDLTYNDTVDGSGATVSIPANTVPLVLNSVSYAPGT